MSNPTLFRSVNLQDDLAAPERLSVYQPTRRSIPVVEAVMDGGATMVMAAYGSGKSLAAGVGSLFVLNNRPDVTKPLAERLRAIDARVGDGAAARTASKGRGRVIVLSGYVRDIPATLSEALGLPRKRSIEPIIDALNSLKDSDRLAIVWDEFGRHLEGIINEGRARELNVVQRLAEWAVRAPDASASLTLLLHQNLLAYANALNQTSRNEWRKIEGRFAQVRFVEDSQQLYELAARTIEERRPEGVRPPNATTLRATAKRVVEAGWFDRMSDLGRIQDLLAMSYPMSAAALHVLPHLVARIGQNERSLFAFLETAELSRPIGMEEIYLSFSDAMRSDVGIGGAHRRWVETETARSRAEDGIEREVLAAACLLQLGVDGQRHKLTRETLEAAVTSRGVTGTSAKAAVDALISRKLLLHRQLNNDVSVWHGADLDLASRIAEERARRLEGFDLLKFLEAQHPAPFIRPTRHNMTYGTTRYLRGQYVLAVDLAPGRTLLEGEQPSAEWGRVLFVLADTAEEISLARRQAEAGLPSWGRLLFALPSEPVSIGEAALEVETLLALQRDDGLRAEDPLVGQEVAELLAVARRQLSVMLHRLTTDRPAGTEWWHDGRLLEVDADHPVGIAASDLLDAAYPNTPRIFNDQVMRNRLSRQMETARVRILTRIFEKGDEPQLGLREQELSSAEGSVYRTVLEATGLHKSASGGFADPLELTDLGLRAAWSIIREFFTAPGMKSLLDVVSQLSSPPVGVPLGVIPILVIAGLKAFGRAVSIRTEGIFMADLLGFVASRMFVDSGRTTVEVHDGGDATLTYLAELAYVFSHQRPAPSDEHVSFAADALTAWHASLSDGVKRSRRHTDDGRALLRMVAESDDLSRLLLDKLPWRFGGGRNPAGPLATAVMALERTRTDIDRLIDGYVRDAVQVVGEVLTLNEHLDPVAGVQAWAKCFDVTVFLRRDDITMVDKAVVRTANDTLNGRYSPESLAWALSSILLQRGLDNWEDGTPERMRRLLRECRSRIEDAALASAEPNAGMKPIIEARIADLEAKLAALSAAAPSRTSAFRSAG